MFELSRVQQHTTSTTLKSWITHLHQPRHYLRSHDNQSTILRSLHLSLALDNTNTDTITHLTSITMSCPLDKLAPETRTMIYEYVLSFDMPLKHATKMQPFVKKLTGSEVKSAPPHSTDSGIETITEPQRVNTSILTASKLIYVEAIAVFYKRNTIHVDAELCARENIVSPRATDLSLATHVVVKMDGASDPEADASFGKAVFLSLTTIPAIFPQVRTCSVDISVDTDLYPSVLLVSLGSYLRDLNLFSKVYFSGVGSMHAVLEKLPCLELVLQSRWTIGRWANPDPIPAGAVTLEDVSTTSLYQASRADSQNIYAQYAKDAFDFFNTNPEPILLENVEQDGYEFWTVVDAYQCAIQDLRP